MYDFVKMLWLNGGLDETQLKRYCPVFITQEELEKIISLKQEQ